MPYSLSEYPTPEPIVYGQEGPNIVIFDGRRVALWRAERPDYFEPLNGETGQRFEKFYGAHVEDPEPEVAEQALAAYKANPPEYEPLPPGAR